LIVDKNKNKIMEAINAYEVEITKNPKKIY